MLMQKAGNDNLQPGAQELANAYKSAGSPKQLRGFSTNVAGWNSWDQSPGEFSSSSDAQYNKCQNEKIYVDTFSGYLSTAGMPNHAIVDTGRNGVTGLRLEWGDWCNVAGVSLSVPPCFSLQFLSVLRKMMFAFRAFAAFPMPSWDIIDN